MKEKRHCLIHCMCCFYILLPYEIFSSFICEEILNMINRERKWHCWYENFRRFKPHLLLRLFKALVIHRTACTTNVFKAFVWKYIRLVAFPKVHNNRLLLNIQSIILNTLCQGLKVSFHLKFITDSNGQIKLISYFILT